MDLFLCNSGFARSAIAAAFRVEQCPTHTWHGLLTWEQLLVYASFILEIGANSFNTFREIPVPQEEQNCIQWSLNFVTLVKKRSSKTCSITE